MPSTALTAPDWRCTSTPRVSGKCLGRWKPRTSRAAGSGHVSHSTGCARSSGVEQTRGKVPGLAGTAATAQGQCGRGRAGRAAQRGWKWQPEGRPIRLGGVPAIGSSSPTTPSNRGIERSRPRCRDGWGAVRTCSVEPRLNDPSGIHDGDLVGHLGDDAEVVGDQHIAIRARAAGARAAPKSPCRWRRSSEVCSSAMGEPSDSVGGSPRDHHTLALAAGELVRVGPQALARVGNADEVEQLEWHARARRPSRRRGERGSPR